MQRRAFVKSVAAMGAASLAAPYGHTRQYDAALPQPQVKRVLVMFKCHFDAGFIDTQAHVQQRYFSEFFPRAIEIAAEQRAAGPNRYVWTTGSWLLYEYLDQADPPARRKMEQAILQGDIAWHALPFTWQTELMDPSMIAGALGISDSLDRRFGRKTTGAKMSDVPGHTRGLVAPLARHGVTFLDIGVNGASTTAELPPLFLWKDAAGASLIVMYHPGYGGRATVPGADLVIDVEVRGDNSGPHTEDEIAEVFSGLRKQYPNAEITASGLTEIANAVSPYAARLPVVNEEIGDTWIYGVASDPTKLARYREVARLRERWIAEGKFNVGDSADVALLRHLLLEVEHTWGMDTKTWLDFDHYRPADLAKMLDTRNYRLVASSWAEKRQDLLDGIAALPAPMRSEANAALESLRYVPPPAAGMKSHPADQAIETTHFIVALDATTGAICRLQNRKTGRQWASGDHPLALFCYQALSHADYDPFFTAYIRTTADWARKDFGKPNMESFGAVSREWLPTLEDLRRVQTAQGTRILARLAIRDEASLGAGLAAFPKDMFLDLWLPDQDPRIELNFSWAGKPATRMPEALWLTFHPVVPSAKGWSFDKSGETIHPLEVVPGGGRRMHAVGEGFAYADSEGRLAIKTIDAPLIALGSRSPLNFSKAQPDLSQGIHSNLFNNAWGTNYLMWFGEDMRFRYVIEA